MFFFSKQFKKVYEDYLFDILRKVKVYFSGILNGGADF